MLERSIPSTGEKLPVIGMGTWKKLDIDANEPGCRVMSDIVGQFVKGGGKLIDTSPMYGKAEAAIGHLTKATSVADDLFYATKVWTTGLREGIFQMEQSLRLMNRKQLDLIQIHNLLDWQTHLKTLEHWKKDGKVRYTGITHYTVAAHAQLEDILRSHTIDFVQFNYSIGIRDAEKSLLPAAAEKGVAVLINEPLEKGHLFRKVQGKSLPAWATEAGIDNWAQFFLGYILSHPAVTAVIPATGKLENLLANISAGNIPLPDEQLRNKMAKYWDSL